MPAVLADPALKRQFVTPMFEHIAPRYDRFTRLFSFGMDATWKADLLSWLPVLPDGGRGATVLDLACGTGDLALGAAARLPNAHVTGIDASDGMIDRARRRASARAAPVEFRVGDMSATGVGDSSMDVVLAGYAFRNAPSLRPALREVERVLRPGGVLLSLDFYLPEEWLWRAAFTGYLRLAGSVVGWLWHRSPVLYAYIADSVRMYVSAPEFSRALANTGMTVTHGAMRLRGGIGLHSATRTDDAVGIAGR
ncbi:MAG: class I SAM-dependent methyltransferase [Gemmatimonadota bacterium]